MLSQKKREPRFLLTLVISKACKADLIAQSDEVAISLSNKKTRAEISFVSRL